MTLRPNAPLAVTRSIWNAPLVGWIGIGSYQTYDRTNSYPTYDRTNSYPYLAIYSNNIIYQQPNSVVPPYNFFGGSSSTTSDCNLADNIGSTEEKKIILMTEIRLTLAWSRNNNWTIIWHLRSIIYITFTNIGGDCSDYSKYKI
jgi:hypothetical protein